MYGSVCNVQGLKGGRGGRRGEGRREKGICKGKGVAGLRYLRMSMVAGGPLPVEAIGALRPYQVCIPSKWSTVHASLYVHVDWSQMIGSFLTGLFGCGFRVCLVRFYIDGLEQQKECERERKKGSGQTLTLTLNSRPKSHTIARHVRCGKEEEEEEARHDALCRCFNYISLCAYIHIPSQFLALLFPRAKRDVGWVEGYLLYSILLYSTLPTTGQ